MGRAEDRQQQERGGRYRKGGQGVREMSRGQERRRETTMSPSTTPSPDREEEETDPAGRSPEPRGPSRERRVGRGQRGGEGTAEEMRGKGKGGQGGGEQRSKVGSRSEGSHRAAEEDDPQVAARHVPGAERIYARSQQDRAPHCPTGFPQPEINAVGPRQGPRKETGTATWGAAPLHRSEVGTRGAAGEEGEGGGRRNG